MKFIRDIILISILIFSGCGEDGEDGKSYLKFSWSTVPSYYTDNNPNIPTIIVKNSSYRVYSGTYNFSYVIESYDKTYSYGGNYTITINKGEKGSFLVDGQDGGNKYFTLNLGVLGPSFSGGGYYKESSNVIKKTAFHEINSFDSDYITQTLRMGNSTIELKYQQKISYNK